MHRQQFTYTCKLQRDDGEGTRRGRGEGRREEERIPLTMVALSVRQWGGVIGLPHFPSRIVTRSESARRQISLRYVSRLTRNATCRTKRNQQKRITARRKVRPPLASSIPRASHRIRTSHAAVAGGKKRKEEKGRVSSEKSRREISSFFYICIYIFLITIIICNNRDISSFFSLKSIGVLLTYE